MNAPTRGPAIDNAFGTTKNLLMDLPMFSSLVFRTNKILSGIQ